MFVAAFPTQFWMVTPEGHQNNPNNTGDSRNCVPRLCRSSRGAADGDITSG